MFEISPLIERDCNFFLIIIYSFHIFSCIYPVNENADIIAIYTSFAKYIRLAIKNKTTGKCTLHSMTIIGRFLSEQCYLSPSIQKSTQSIIEFIVEAVEVGLPNINEITLASVLENCVATISHFDRYASPDFTRSILVRMADFINEQFRLNHLKLFPLKHLSFILYVFAPFCIKFSDLQPLCMCVFKAVRCFNDNILNHLSDRYNPRTLSYFAFVFSACHSINYESNDIILGITNIADVIMTQYAQNPKGLLSFCNLYRFMLSFNCITHCEKVKLAVDVIVQSMVELAAKGIQFELHCKVLANLIEVLGMFYNHDNQNALRAVEIIAEAIIDSRVKNQFEECSSRSLCKILWSFSVWLDSKFNIKVLKNAIITITEVILERHSHGKLGTLDSLSIYNFSNGLGGWLEMEKNEIWKQAKELIKMVNDSDKGTND